MAFVPLQSAPDVLPVAQVVRLSPAARAARLIAVLAVLALVLAGTVWGDDDAFPIGQAYALSADVAWASVPHARRVSPIPPSQLERLSEPATAREAGCADGALPRGAGRVAVAAVSSLGASGAFT